MTTLTQKQINELKNLLAAQEDWNISDYEYVNKAGKILDLGKWTGKGKKQLNLKD